jgi:hypothetical protein
VKPAFLDPLRLEELPDGRWQLVDHLCYDSAIIGRHKVPAGFTTDLASVPRLPFAYWLFGGKANRPAVVHDHLYQGRQVSRETADAVFFEAMGVEGLWGRKWPMWAAVRTFGWLPWSRADERAEALNPELAPSDAASSPEAPLAAPPQD